ncbi:SDR family oxidoreductase [Brevibacillus humidisoli]|uniref:SDR family oxidoreductase n=1 Tax=Brevibacillus humidisoli TaxID=2895522 RepID=UPI001E54C514|nr:SDR family oxidoreductase [Brevibacillus humidisoli]UFJ41042.1 SDR family oxidoreductase [Brevibacillus humidisoli]
MSIVVTGATGQLGSLVVHHLLKKDVPAGEIAVVARRPEKASALAALGVEVRYGDYDDAASLKKAFAGASKLLLISAPSPDNTLRIRQHATAVEAARDAGAGYIVYTGLAFAEKLQTGLEHVHLATEYALRTTGIPFTVLRNGFYTDLFVDKEALQAIIERGEIVTSAENGRLNTATRNDLALAAANVLTSEGHENKFYELASPSPWTFDDLAAALSEVSGKTVVHRSVSAEQAVQEMIRAGVPEGAASFMVHVVYHAVSEGQFGYASQDLQNLIGEAITPLQEAVRHTLQD